MDVEIKYIIQSYSDARSAWVDEYQPFDDEGDVISFLTHLRKDESGSLWRAVKVTTTYEAIAA